MRLRTEVGYYAPQVRPDWGPNSRHPDHDSTFHVTETPALTTWPLVTSKEMYCHIILEGNTSHICSPKADLDHPDAHYITALNALPAVSGAVIRVL